MKGVTVDFDQITHVEIAGNSGAGKSYALVYLLNVINKFADLVIVDPKYDSPSRWGKDHSVRVVHPDDSSSE